MTMLALKKTRITFIFTLVLFSLFSCVTPPPPVVEPVVTPSDPVVTPVTPPITEPVVTTPPVASTFDVTTITEEIKQTTFIDIRKFMETLNAVIQAKNFETWNSYLTDAYRAYYSKPEVLAELSNQYVIKRQGIVLKTLKDYFIYVVYPSRQNDRVDAIEFIGQTRVKAFTTNAKGDRLVLYILEKIGDIWMITRQ